MKLREFTKKEHPDDTYDIEKDPELDAIISRNTPEDMTLHRKDKNATNQTFPYKQIIDQYKDQIIFISSNNASCSAGVASMNILFRPSISWQRITNNLGPLAEPYKKFSLSNFVR